MKTEGSRVPSPSVLVLPIIDVCDGRCAMCGIWRRVPRPPIHPERLAQILADPLVSGSLTHMNITGGEPVEHPSFAEIATVLSRSCPALVEVNVNTSGLAAERTIVGVESFRDSLDSRVAMMVTISLDGIGILHDRVRGVKGAFAETKRAIEGCVALARQHPNLTAHLNCTISRVNYTGVSEVIAWARTRSIGLTLTAAAANDLYLGNDVYRPRFALKPEQSDSLAGFLDSLQDDEGFPLTERNYYKMLAGMLRGEARSCRCVYQAHGIFLDLDGVVYPCGTAGRLPYGRLPEEPFSEIYMGPRGDEVRRQLLSAYCPTCPTNSYHGLAEGVWLKVLKQRRAARCAT